MKKRKIFQEDLYWIVLIFSLLVAILGIIMIRNFLGYVYYTPNAGYGTTHAGEAGNIYAMNINISERSGVWAALYGTALWVSTDPNNNARQVNLTGGNLTRKDYSFNCFGSSGFDFYASSFNYASLAVDDPILQAGNIGAAVGLKNVKTGDTICDEKEQILLESMDFPDPVISLAIEPKTKADREKLSTALQRLSEEDPTFRIKSNEETGQTLISGMGELHLEVLTDRMFREFKVEANVGKPQVAFKETVSTGAKAEGKYIKQTGGRGQYGHCYLELEPQERGKGIEFVNKVVGGAIPREYISAVEAGVREACQNGVLAGYPVVDVKCTVYDGSYHDVDSSEIAFKMAGSIGFKECARRAKPVLLEPIMAIEVVVPEEYMGDIIGDLNSRRCKIEMMGERGNLRYVRGTVPLNEVFGYATAIRSLSQGRATYSMEPHSYQEVPKNLAEAIIEGVSANK